MTHESQHVDGGSDLCSNLTRTSTEVPMTMPSLRDVEAEMLIHRDLSSPAQVILDKLCKDHPEYVAKTYPVEGFTNPHLRVHVWRDDERTLSEQEMGIIAQYVKQIFDLLPFGSMEYWIIPYRTEAQYLLRAIVHKTESLPCSASGQ
jgi:hypothetical protein